MGFFNKPDQQTNIQTNTTIIASGTKVTGTIKTTCALHIDGAHNGKIEANGAVTIGQNGKVDGEVSAKSFSVTGYFMGTADCDEVEILPGGDVKGKIISSNLSIDHDCNFEGESVKRASKNAPKAIKQTLTKIS